jgi:hypothetical protein
LSEGSGHDERGRGQQQYAAGKTSEWRMGHDSLSVVQSFVFNARSASANCGAPLMPDSI